jgi:hypothetical protein
VKTLVDPRLRAEAARFTFRFACDDCVHFAPEASACSLAFEAAPRRDGLDAGKAAVELCKTFELA